MKDYCAFMYMIQIKKRWINREFLHEKFDSGIGDEVPVVYVKYVG